MRASEPDRDSNNIQRPACVDIPDQHDELILQAVWHWAVDMFANVATLFELSIVEWSHAPERYTYEHKKITPHLHADLLKKSSIVNNWCLKWCHYNVQIYTFPSFTLQVRQSWYNWQMINLNDVNIDY